MKCKKCGTVLDKKVNFCTNCGEPVNGKVSKASTTKFKVDVKQILLILRDAIIKPFANIKNNNETIEDIRYMGLFAGIISVALTVIELIITFIGALIGSGTTETCATYFGIKSCTETTITFGEKLGEVSWGAFFVQYLIAPAAIAFIIAGIYYFGAKFMKKEVNFGKMSFIALLSFVPFYAFEIIAPILTAISGYITIAVGMIALFYSLLVLYNHYRKEIVIQNEDKSLLFHTACAAVIIIIIVIFVALIIGSAVNQITSLL